jgi:hypothetical protein
MHVHTNEYIGLISNISTTNQNYIFMNYISGLAMFHDSFDFLPLIKIWWTQETIYPIDWAAIKTKGNIVFWSIHRWGRYLSCITMKARSLPRRCADRFSSHCIKFSLPLSRCMRKCKSYYKSEKKCSYKSNPKISLCRKPDSREKHRMIKSPSIKTCTHLRIFSPHKEI